MNPHEPKVYLVKAVLEKLSFGHFPMPIEIKVKHDHLHIKITTKDRDTGTASYVQCYRQIPPWFENPSDFMGIIHWIEVEILELIKHELEEFMLYDKQRVFDPHKPQEQRPNMMPQEVVDQLFKATGQGKQG